MIVKEEFLKNIRSLFNLNIYEAKIWVSLLSRGVASAGELSEISNVPRSRSYDVLESLEKRGFIIVKIGKPIKYIAVKPEEVVKRIRDKVKQDTNTQLNYLEKIKVKPVFKEMELLFKQGITNVDPNSLSGAIKGRNNINSQIDSIISGAKKSVLIATTPEGFARKIKKFNSTFKRLKQNNVNIKILTQITEKNKQFAEEAKKFSQIKNAKNINSRFIIVDGQEMLFMIEDDRKVHESYDSAIWVKTPFFAQTMETMFNNLWR